MSKNHALKPRLRFQTPTDKNQEWVVTPMGELFSNSKLKGKEGLPTLSVTIDRGLVLRDSNERKTETNLSANEHRLVKKGEIAYNTMRMWQGAYGRASFDGMVSPAYVILSQSTQLRSDFSEYFLKLSRTRYLFWAYSYGLTNDRLRLYYDDFAKIKAAIPTLPEQEKIAAFLTSVDDRIDQLKRKKSLLQDYKKGVMQKLFSQELRFKDDHGKPYPDWEEKKLGDVCLKKSSNITAGSLKDIVGEYLVYGASGETGSIDTFAEDQEFIGIVKDGAGVGRTMLCKPYTSVLGTMDIIKEKQGNHLRFIYGILNLLNFKKHVNGSTIPHIYFKDYSQENISTPSLPEQTKIANFLSTLDQKIEQIDTQITQTQTFKKGLLQQMFV